MGQEMFEEVFIESEEALYEWLSVNHNSARSYLLVTWKKADRARYISRDTVLDALIAYGWIDGRRFARADDKTSQLICQRQQQKWAKSYRERYERLAAQNRLHEAGMAAAARAKKAGTWLVDEDVDALILPDDLRDCLIAEGGLSWWQSSAPSYQRNLLRHLRSAKTDKTRQKRLYQIAEACASGRKIPHF
ncbi:MAG: YdeI/OmpD-associated family protein [Candidatus Puniceispirillaceae bacterium]